MTVLGNVLAARNSLENPELPLTSKRLMEFLGVESPAAGVAVSEEKSLGLPAVWRATTLIAGTCASLPLKPYRSNTGTRQPLETGRAAELLAYPHPDLTPFEFWELVYGHLCLWGNAYLWIGRDKLGRIAELWPIHPARIKAGRGSASLRRPELIGKKVYLLDGDLELDDTTILHISGFGYDGVCGVSPVRAARQGLSLALAAEEFGARFFGNGTLATGVLQTEQRLSEEQADRMLKRWQSKHAGLDKSHDVIVLDSGAQFTQLSIPPEDAQFLQSRQFQIAEVCRMFGVPPFLMFETEKSTSWGTGLEQQAIGWVKYDLRRWYMRVEQRLTRLIDPANVYVHYNVEGLLRGDSAARKEFYRGMWDMGALSTNEIRALEEMDEVEGGDVRYRPLNMGELGTVDEGSSSTTTETTQTRPTPAAPEEDSYGTRSPRFSHA